MSENTILLNWDADIEYFFLRFSGGFENIADKARGFIDTYYRDRGIGDILFNVFAQSSVTPSRVFTDRLTKYRRKEENGVPVDYSGEDRLALPAICREKYGVGLTELWIERCREVGIRPWISVRMNDNHFRDEKTCFLRSDFFYEALENGWVLGDGYRSGHRNWDYAAEPVRRKMLDYISEQLDALDVYGIELDFMREPKCVRYLDPGDHCGAVNSFMERVKEVVKEKERRRGRPIRIAIRLPRDPMLARRIGFDAVYWAAHGLADAIVPSSHWLCTDTDMPISEWTRLLSPYGVEVWACMEMNLPNRLPVSAETAKAHTAQYAAQGSARTYVFNLYHPFFEKLEAEGVFKGIWAKTPTTDETLRIWELGGDPEKCRRGVRRHVVTEEIFGFQEIKPRWAPLPLTLGDGAILEVRTGPIGENECVTVFFCSPNAGAKELNVSLDGEVCLPTDDADADILRAGADPEAVLAYSVPRAKREGVTRTLWITGPKDAVITYAELKIDAR